MDGRSAPAALADRRSCQTQTKAAPGQEFGPAGVVVDVGGRGGGGALWGSKRIRVELIVGAAWEK